MLSSKGKKCKDDKVSPFLRKEEFSKGEIKNESKCESRPGSATAMIKSERTTVAANL